MKAIVMHDFGGPEVMKCEDVPTPKPAEGEVLVKVGAVSVNRGFDIGTRSGKSAFNPKLPLILGVDPSGELVDVGDGVDKTRIGQRVHITGMARCGKCAGCREKSRCLNSKMIGVKAQGGYAEYIAVPEFQARQIPENLDYADATVICRHAAAAFSEIHTAQLKEGEWVLVMGAAGALGSFLLQLARLKGVRIIAGASSDERLEVCKELGADYGINYREKDLAAEIARITDGHGVDVVFENIGDPDLWTPAFDSMARNGRLVTVGYHGGGIVPLDVQKLHMRSLKVLSSPMGAGSKDALGDCLALAAEGKLRALIGKKLPLSEAAQAHELVENNAVIGKVILEP